MSYFFSKDFLYFWPCWVFTAVQAFSSCTKRGFPFTEVCGLLLTVASLAVEHRLEGAGAVAVARGLSSWSSLALEHSPSCCGAWA